MEWELRGKGGAVRGPLGEDAVTAEIAAGLPATTQARPVGKEAWKPIGGHAPFAEALAAARIPAAPTSPPRSSPWTIVTACASVAAVGALVVGLVLWQRSDREAKQERADQAAALSATRDDIAAMRGELHGATITTMVSAKETTHICSANNNEFMCTITNLTAAPLTTCMLGSLVQKKATGIKLLSLPLCTGRLAPRETTTIHAPWVGGNAKDVCASQDRFGMELDWEACDFKETPFDPERATK